MKVKPNKKHEQLPIAVCDVHCSVYARYAVVYTRACMFISCFALLRKQQHEVALLTTNLHLRKLEASYTLKSTTNYQHVCCFACLAPVSGGHSKLHLLDLGLGSRSRDSPNAMTSAAICNVMLGLLNGQRHIAHR